MPLQFRPLPTKSELEKWFEYDPDTGTLYKIAEIYNKLLDVIPVSPKRPVGCLLRGGYLVTRVPRAGGFMVSRIIWVLQTGVDPGKMQVDHINGNKEDNAWSNLRLASNQENSRNRPKRRSTNGKPATSAYKGVSVFNGRIQAGIYFNGKRHHLGTFPTEEAAHAAYCEAAKKYHGEFARLK